MHLERLANDGRPQLSFETFLLRNNLEDTFERMCRPGLHRWSRCDKSSLSQVNDGLNMSGVGSTGCRKRWRLLGEAGMPSRPRARSNLPRLRRVCGYRRLRRLSCTRTMVRSFSFARLQAILKGSCAP